MDELSAAMQEVAKLQANSVKMQSEVVLLEAELKKERAQHLATSQQLEIAQSTPGDYKANKKDLDARLTECQRKLDEALTAKRHVVAQLNTNQHKSFEMLEILEKTREELAAAKSRALEQENRAHKMAIRLAEAKTAGGNVEAELQSCLEKFANYKQDLDDLKENRQRGEIFSLLGSLLHSESVCLLLLADLDLDDTSDDAENVQLYSCVNN